MTLKHAWIVLTGVKMKAGSAFLSDASLRCCSSLRGHNSSHFLDYGVDDRNSDVDPAPPPYHPAASSRSRTITISLPLPAFSASSLLNQVGHRSRSSLVCTIREGSNSIVPRRTG